MRINMFVSTYNCLIFSVDCLFRCCNISSVVQVSLIPYKIFDIKSCFFNYFYCRAIQSGLETEPVMCQTINTTMVNNCPWASCGEWCLTKPSGHCPQIHATVRRNGTDIQLDNCTRITTVACPQVKVIND